MLTKNGAIFKKFLLTCAFGVFTFEVNSSSAVARTFYVDFTYGSNSADGASITTAWRQAPGDLEATGVPLATTLVAGDVVIFRAGVRYRGTIRLSKAGTASLPIIYSGTGWGAGQAIMDGSDLLPAPVACATSAACLGAPNLIKTVVVTVPDNADWQSWLFGTSGRYEVSQNPTITAGNFYDDVSLFSIIPLSETATLDAGSIRVIGQPPSGKGQPILALWNTGNQIVYKDFTISSANIISFDPANFSPYLDRENRYSILNDPAFVNRAGVFAISGKDRVAIVSLRGTDTRLTLGSGRNGFILAQGAHNVTIRNFSFMYYAGRSTDIRSGVPILGISDNDGIKITGNRFSESVLLNGQGAINMSFAKNLLVKSNRIKNIGYGSGIRVGSTRGPLEVSCNDIDNVGRTAIAAINAYTITIRNNYIRNINGIHGNGISSYLDNRAVRITGNVVTASIRPLTLNSNNGVPYFTGDPTEPQTLIANNIFIGNTVGIASAINWGGQLNNVTFDGNQFGGKGTALRLQGDETGFRLVNNILAGQLVFTKVPDNGSIVQVNTQFVDVTTGNASMEAQARIRGPQCPAS